MDGSGRQPVDGAQVGTVQPGSAGAPPVNGFAHREGVAPRRDPGCLEDLRLG